MNCKEGTQIIVDQMTEVLGKLDAGPYAQPLQLFNGSTIGQHFRHIIDFYGCLARGLNDGRIDYAKRERDKRIETDPGYASEMLQVFTEEIRHCDENTDVLILADFSADLNAERPVVKSTLARELMYAYDHAVHHLAMIKMGLKTINADIEVQEELGVAPSTLKYWKEKGRN